MTTSEELLALSYDGFSPQSTDLLASDYRKAHQENGESFRWFKAYRSETVAPFNNTAIRGADGVESGRVYVEQELAASVKALVWDSKKDMGDVEGTIYPAGTTMFSVMPNDAYIAHMDRVVLVARETVFRTVMKREAGTNFDGLKRTPAVVIIDVRQNGTVYVGGTDYQLNADRIEWLGAKPSDGSLYAIEFRFQPTFSFLGTEYRLPRRDPLGELMPLRGALEFRDLEN